MPMKKTEFRRRREGKTDYGKRASMLKAGAARLVVRKTNKYILAQIVRSEEAQDYVVCTANSSELRKIGAKGSLKNTKAAYLTGMLVAKKALEKGVASAIADFGNLRSTKGGKIYAVLKGASDNGLKTKFDDKMAPAEERIGKEDGEDFNSIKEKIANSKK